MDHLAGAGINVIHELGCVPGNLLHADTLRKTGRMPVTILSGEFPAASTSGLATLSGLRVPEKNPQSHR